MTPVPDATAEQEAARFRDDYARVKAEIGRVIVGQEEVVDGVLTCLFAAGHALLEGVPGLGKTMLVRTLADTVDLSFSRIQFTPDLMPADIVGTHMIVEDAARGRRFEFQRGPVFCHVLLADEINRATPKTQSALLEAMQEGSVTVARTTHTLEEPFFVLATQNPLEMEGTYPLPEAQLDRFFYKLRAAFPDAKALGTILERTTQAETPRASAVLARARALEMRALVRRVPAARAVQDWTVRVLMATHPESPDAPDLVRRFVRYGASPRGAQAMLLGARIRALVLGRFAAARDDVRACCLPALRHRLILNFEGEAEGIGTDTVLLRVLETVPEA
jgi:MoxR-like ATPase